MIKSIAQKTAERHEQERGYFRRMIEDLAGKNEDLAAENQRLLARVQGQEEEIVKLMAWNERLQDALRPFADAYNDMKEKGLAGYNGIGIRDLAAAERVLGVDQPK